MRFTAVIFFTALIFARAARGDERERPWMIELGAGPDVGVHQSGGTGRPPFYGGFVSLTIGVAPTHDLRFHLIVPLQVQLAGTSYTGYTALMIPFGVEYDEPLWRSLYTTARFSVGYAAVFIPLEPPLHFGFVLPELGLKYVWRKRWFAGIDLASIPIGFGTDDNHKSIVPVSYRTRVYFGADF